MALRAVVFGVDGVLLASAERPADAPDTGLTGPTRTALAGEVKALLAFLRDRGVRPLVLANRERPLRTADGRTLSLGERLTALYGEHHLFVAERGDMPWKPRRESLATVLAAEGLAPSEVVYVGTIDADARTALGNGVLFCNATWDRRDVDYGLTFDAPRELVRFLDLHVLREHPWFYGLDAPVRFRSMAPYTTRNTDPATEAYGVAAVAAAKQGTADRHFFLNMLVGSLYASGLVGTFQYIACVPGHEASFGNPAMNDALETFGRAVRARFTPDLVVRHTSVVSSKAERIERRDPQAVTQFNSIHLTKKPLKASAPGAERYKTPIKLAGKTVLVVDDFSTGGLTLEAVRHYLAQAGAQALLAPWLKTVSRGYQSVTVARAFDPFVPNTFTAKELRAVEHRYADHIVDPAAQAEFGRAFARYKAGDKAV